MRQPTGVESLYLDFDSFFASAEQHLRPDLRGRPVAVVPIMTPHTACIAASREAKARGVKTHTPVREARRLCPELILVEGRPDQYIQLHKQILETIGGILPVRAVRSIDEVWCALMDNEQSRALEIAHSIKAALAACFSPALTCSIGLAPNELLAKIAAEMDKPDGLVVLHPRDLPGRLLDLELTDIPGIASGNAARLARAGIQDVAGLWAMAPKELRALWGSVEGERFWAFLHGYAVERPPTERCMFGHSRVLAREWRNPDKARDCARLLLGKAARRMRREGFHARSLYLSLREGEERWSGEERFPPRRDDHAFLTALDHLFRRAWASGAPRRPKGVHVSLAGLVTPNELEQDLFEAADPARARWETVSTLMDGLIARRAPVSLGPRVELPGGYAGLKIAFNRVPDLQDGF
jgi:DNA polymerase-4